MSSIFVIGIFIFYKIINNTVYEGIICYNFIVKRHELFTVVLKGLILQIINAVMKIYLFDSIEELGEDFVKQCVTFFHLGEQNK